MALTQLLKTRSFEGSQEIYSLSSQELRCDTKFAIYLPPQAEETKVPVLYLLAGSTSTEESFIRKSGVQRYASEHGICLVCPDASPRNVDIPGQNDEPGVIGDGAGFYIDATQSPWSKHYRMFSYINFELIHIVNENFPVTLKKQSVCGYSMGGHGAIVSALKNPGLYCSVSALAPIVNPTRVSLGQRRMTAYFGDDQEIWREWDSTELAASYTGVPVNILIDQGTDDDYYANKILLPENLVAAAETNDRVTCMLRMREGYDHSYYFVSSLIGEHIEYHSNFLNSTKSNCDGEDESSAFCGLAK